MGIVESTYAELKQQELKNNPYSCLHMADIDINPHQIEAFTFALSSLELGGAILADEVGLGKTIEAGLVIKYLLCSGKNKILLIMPSNLRKQWQVELEDKFDIDSLIVDSSNWEDYLTKVKSKQAVIIVSYHFASKRKAEFGKIAWDLCVFDEAHRLRNVYKNGSKMANALYELTKGIPKILLTATPMQNTLLDIYGLVQFIAKTDFLRHMSHDIRTPLNGIIGMINISERYYGDQERLYECKAKVMESMDYLQSLLNNVLDIGKVESGTIQLEHKPFDLVAMLVKQISIVETNAKEYGIRFEGGVSMSTFHHRYVIGSEEYLNRLLMNIAGNAVKYNRSGGKVILYFNEISSDDKTAVFEFVCSDTGLGMSEEFQKHAFESYAREGKETTNGYSGAGLGLSIVKDIVDRMNGTIKLESKENVGTTFTVTIPLEIDHNAEKEQQKKVEKPDLSGKSVLLVEDNELNLEIAKMLLEDEKMVVTTAENGKEAVDIVSQSVPGRFDFIFMDMMMPVMDGLEAARQIRTLNRKDTKEIPIIAMTANAFQDDIRDCIDAGMNAHIAKPIDSKKIEDTLQLVLKQKMQ